MDDPGSGVVLRVSAGGRQTYEPLAHFDPAQNRFVPVPIALDVETDQVFLILFGTGFRFPGQTATVMAGGERAEALYAGSQGALAGVDQANIRLSLGLKGRGEVDIVLAVDGVASNAVRVSIK